MKTILITGARAPTALEWTRRFAKNGAKIYVGDSMEFPLTRGSKWVEKYFKYPSASQHTVQFINVVKKAIEDYKIDIIIPTCEEIFYLSRFKDLLPPRCSIFCDEFNKLRTVHHKYEFLETAQGCGVSIPRTHLIETPQDLNPFLACSQSYVFKPVFSRFATRVLISPQPQHLTTLKVTSDDPWVAQQLIEGKEYCSYSIAIKGKMHAHVCYHPRFRAGQGSGIYFNSIAHPGIEKFVKMFVEKLKWHGQVAFDFIETSAGEIFVLECNPRATSGIHCLESHLDGTSLVEGRSTSSIPANPLSKMVGLAMATYGLKYLSLISLSEWINAFHQGRDVIWCSRDARPFFYQFLTLGEIALKSILNRTSLISTTTADGEWNGQEL